MTSGKLPSHFAELLDFLPDVLAWVKDRQGRYLWVNRAFLIQYSLDHPGGNGFAAVENIQGKTDYDLSPAFLADQFRHDDEQVLAGHRIVNRLERVGESRGYDGLEHYRQDPRRRCERRHHWHGRDYSRRRTREQPRSHRPRLRAGAGSHARPFPSRDHQSAPRVHFEHVAPRVRTAVPCRLPSHPAKISAKASAAHCESRLDVHG